MHRDYLTTLTFIPFIALSMLAVAAGGCSGASGAPTGGASDASLAGDAIGESVEAGSTPSDASTASSDADALAAMSFPPDRHACMVSSTAFVQLPLPPQGPPLQACVGSDKVLVPDAHVDLPDGGKIVAGSTAILTAEISNPGSDPLDQPCVGVVASREGVTIGDGGPVVSAVSAGGMATVTVPLTFDPNIFKGRILIGLWAVWQGTPLPDAGAGPCVAKSSTIVDLTVN